MNTTFSASAHDQAVCKSDANPPSGLAQVIRRNLAGDGCCPLDYLTEARESTAQLGSYLLEHYQLPEAVAHELEAAQLAIAQASLHLRMAATRCS